MKKQIWHNPDNVPASKVPKGWRFQESLWAIWSPYAGRIIPGLINKSKKLCWDAFVVMNNLEEANLKKKGLCAIKVTVSYEVKE